MWVFFFFFLLGPARIHPQHPGLAYFLHKRQKSSFDNMIAF